MIGWLLLGLLLYKRGVEMKLCQIKPASEMGASEIAKTICLCNGEIAWGREGHDASPVSVRINPNSPSSCPEGCKPLGVYHTHPKGTSEPSSQDISEMLRAKLPFLCISGEEALSCYRIK